MTITGTDLDNATAVNFGTTSATISSDTATQIIAISPPGTAGTVYVTVVTAGGTSATSPADQFTYYVATTRNWKGTGGDNHWQTPLNWVGDQKPWPVDALVFPVGTGYLSNTNDYPPGTTFGSLSFSGSNYTVTGNPFVLSGGLSNTGDPAGPNVIAADVTFASATTTVENSGTTTLSGTITASGTMVVTGTGTLIISGPQNWAASSVLQFGIAGAAAYSSPLPQAGEGPGVRAAGVTGGEPLGIVAASTSPHPNPLPEREGAGMGGTKATSSAATVTPNTASGVYYRVFVTSFMTHITGDTTVPPADFSTFGGQNAADWIVTFAAFNAGLIPDWNGLDLIYKAILSTSTSYARDRIQISGPVVNMHGDLVATDAADLWDGQLAAPISYDEYGNLITGSSLVWTGSISNGIANLGNTCGNWNVSTSSDVGSVGDALQTIGLWIRSSIQFCSLTARLYGVSPAITRAPTVTTISPTIGLTTGGTPVTITGTDLDNATAVNFGTVSATISSDTATQIIALSPPGTAGTVHVTVVTAGGTSATSPADQFTYYVATTRNWKGTGGDNHWQTPLNWVGDQKPWPVDALVFPVGTGYLSNTNDYPPGTTFGSLSFSGSNYTVTGNPFVLSGGLSNTGDPAGPNVIAADVTFASATTTVENNGTTTLGGTITASGTLLVTGSGTLIISGPQNWAAGSVLQLGSPGAMATADFSPLPPGEGLGVRAVGTGGLRGDAEGDSPIFAAGTVVGETGVSSAAKIGTVPARGVSDGEPLGVVAASTCPHPNPLPEGEGTDILPLPGATEGDSPIFAAVGSVGNVSVNDAAKIGTVPAKIGTVPARIGTVPWAADGFFHRLGEGSGGGIVDARAYSFFLTTYHKRSAEPDYLWYLDDAADSDGEVAWPELAQFPPRRLRPIGPGSP